MVPTRWLGMHASPTGSGSSMLGIGLPQHLLKVTKCFGSQQPWPRQKVLWENTTKWIQMAKTQHLHGLCMSLPCGEIMKLYLANCHICFNSFSKIECPMKSFCDDLHGLHPLHLGAKGGQLLQGLISGDLWRAVATAIFEAFSLEASGSDIWTILEYLENGFLKFDPCWQTTTTICKFHSGWECFQTPGANSAKKPQTSKPASLVD